MVDEVPLRKAVHTARTVYLATHPDVDIADGRRCLLERHLQGRLEASQARLRNSRVPDSPILTGFPRTNGKADSTTGRTDNSRKRETGLDVARSFVPAFSDAGIGDAIHWYVSLRHLQLGHSPA
jgi:hypothetical protein